MTTNMVIPEVNLQPPKSPHVLQRSYTVASCPLDDGCPVTDVERVLEELGFAGATNPMIPDRFIPSLLERISFLPDTVVKSLDQRILQSINSYRRKENRKKFFRNLSMGRERDSSDDGRPAEYPTFQQRLRCDTFPLVRSLTGPADFSDEKFPYTTNNQQNQETSLQCETKDASTENFPEADRSLTFENGVTNCKILSVSGSFTPVITCSDFNSASSPFQNHESSNSDAVTNSNNNTSEFPQLNKRSELLQKDNGEIIQNKTEATEIRAKTEKNNKFPASNAENASIYLNVSNIKSKSIKAGNVIFDNNINCVKTGNNVNMTTQVLGFEESSLKEVSVAAPVSWEFPPVSIPVIKECRSDKKSLNENIERQLNDNVQYMSCCENGVNSNTYEQIILGNSSTNEKSENIKNGNVLISDLIETLNSNDCVNPFLNSSNQRASIDSDNLNGSHSNSVLCNETDNSIEVTKTRKKSLNDYRKIFLTSLLDPKDDTDDDSLKIEDKNCSQSEIEIRRKSDVIILSKVEHSASSVDTVESENVLCSQSIERFKSEPTEKRLTLKNKTLCPVLNHTPDSLFKPYQFTPKLTSNTTECNKNVPSNSHETDDLFTSTSNHDSYKFSPLCVQEKLINKLTTPTPNRSEVECKNPKPTSNMSLDNSKKPTGASTDRSSVTSPILSGLVSANSKVKKCLRRSKSSIDEDESFTNNDRQIQEVPDVCIHYELKKTKAYHSDTDLAFNSTLSQFISENKNLNFPRTMKFLNHYNALENNQSSYPNDKNLENKVNGYHDPSKTVCDQGISNKNSVIHQDCLTSKIKKSNVVDENIANEKVIQREDKPQMLAQKVKHDLWCAFNETHKNIKHESKNFNSQPTLDDILSKKCCNKNRTEPTKSTKSVEKGNYETFECCRFSNSSKKLSKIDKTSPFLNLQPNDNELHSNDKNFHNYVSNNDNLENETKTRCLNIKSRPKRMLAELKTKANVLYHLLEKLKVPTKTLAFSFKSYIDSEDITIATKGPDSVTTDSHSYNMLRNQNDKAHLEYLDDNFLSNIDISSSMSKCDQQNEMRDNMCESHDHDGSGNLRCDCMIFSKDGHDILSSTGFQGDVGACSSSTYMSGFNVMVNDQNKLDLKPHQYFSSVCLDLNNSETVSSTKDNEVQRSELLLPIKKGKLWDESAKIKNPFQQATKDLEDLQMAIQKAKVTRMSASRELRLLQEILEGKSESTTENEAPFFVSSCSMDSVKKDIPVIKDQQKSTSTKFRRKQYGCSSLTEKWHFDDLDYLKKQMRCIRKKILEQERKFVKNIERICKELSYLREKIKNNENLERKADDRLENLLVTVTELQMKAISLHEALAELRLQVKRNQSTDTATWENKLDKARKEITQNYQSRLFELEDMIKTKDYQITSLQAENEKLRQQLESKSPRLASCQCLINLNDAHQPNDSSCVECRLHCPSRTSSSTRCLRQDCAKLQDNLRDSQLKADNLNLLLNQKLIELNKLQLTLSKQTMDMAQIEKAYFQLRCELNRGTRVSSPTFFLSSPNSPRTSSPALNSKNLSLLSKSAEAVS